jgi:hypothetical protein
MMFAALAIRMVFCPRIVKEFNGKKPENKSKRNSKDSE